MLQLAEDEGLEELQRHFLRQSTLMQSQCWAGHNHRSPRVINALTQQVLTEATLLTFNHICQRLQWPLVRSSDRTTATTVIKQGIDSFLQHTLFIANDNVWGIEIE